MSNEKPNIKCSKCGYQWHTRSKLRKATCPSCNQKTTTTTLLSLVKQFVQQKRGIVGLEAAIVLIAFVIIAAAFSFMVINQGLFATERGKTAIQEGLKQASTPLIVDGTTFVRTSSDGSNVTVMIIPVKAFGVKFVAMGIEQTVITLKVGENAWANMYLGVLYNSSDPTETYDPNGKKFDDFVAFQKSGTVCTHGPYGGTRVTGIVLAIANSNGDKALDSGEKGYMIVTLADEDGALARAEINIEIRLEKSATLSIEFSIPVSMPKDTYVPV
jgi:flagellin FlaB